MIHLFHYRSGSARSELQGIRRVLHRLESSPARTRLAVGAGVYVANADFMRRFGGMQSFRHTPSGDQQRFYSELSDLELSLRSGEPGLALGVGLYRIWLADVLAERRDPAQLLGEALTELSRKASSIRSPASGE